MHHNVNIQEDKVTSALIDGVNQFLMVVRSPLLNLLHDGYEIMHLGDLITTQLNVEMDNGERVISTTTTTAIRTRSRHARLCAAALGPGLTNLRRPLELVQDLARCLASSLSVGSGVSFTVKHGAGPAHENGDSKLEMGRSTKLSEGGFGGIQNCGSRVWTGRRHDGSTGRRGALPPLQHPQGPPAHA